MNRIEFTFHSITDRINEIKAENKVLDEEIWFEISKAQQIGVEPMVSFLKTNGHKINENFEMLFRYERVIQRNFKRDFRL